MNEVKTMILKTYPITILYTHPGIFNEGKSVKKKMILGQF